MIFPFDSTADAGDRGADVSEALAVASERARRHVEDFEMMLRVSARVAREVAGGGAAYPPGVRELARALGDHIKGRADAIEVLVAGELT